MMYEGRLGGTSVLSKVLQQGDVRPLYCLKTLPRKGRSSRSAGLLFKVDPINPK
jgi:hypothetical protein